MIMGETGCGKTRLICYMSELARQGLDVNNMLIMKVHYVYQMCFWSIDTVVQ